MQKRHQYWINFVNRNQCKKVLEIGVFKGLFSQKILNNCPCIEEYIMLDPWRNLTDWNKPANLTDCELQEVYQQAINNTLPFKKKITVLRGTTLEVIDQIDDGSLDFIYIDGDHTLRGITIDLIKSYPKLKPLGTIGGDDYIKNQWHHGQEYDPTFVFPFAKYFTESMGGEFVELSCNQFQIFK